MLRNNYLCTRYPEYNLFTLKGLIPIEENASRCEAGGILHISLLSIPNYRAHIIYEATVMLLDCK